MRASLDRLLRDVTLVTLACAIALGWALFQVAKGLAEFVLTLLGDYERNRVAIYPELPQFAGPLLWEVGGRVLFLAPLVAGLIELAVVLLIALFVHDRYGHKASQPPSV